ncbi:alanine racemase [Coprothermobacteraceae bacterium]|nr:alanine racemase [Coprothermobacteraceae bacterium]
MRLKWAEISKNSLKHNVKAIREMLPSAEIVAVVKDNAYGHDLAATLPALLEAGVTKYAVVYQRDALMVSELGAPWVLVLDDFPDAQLAEEYARRGIRFCITDYDWIERGVLELPIQFHLFIDTGMHREGVPWYATDAIKKISADLGSRLEGICTHMAHIAKDSELYRLQLQRFEEALCLVPDSLMVHVSSSGALHVGVPSYATHVRPGIALYGYTHPEVKPVLSLKATVVHARDVDEGDGVSYGWRWIAQHRTRVVTVPVGYADGYNRLLTNKARAGVNDFTLEQIGTVTMDFTMFKAPSEVRVGDVMTLLGEWGTGRFWADDWAEAIGTIPYEVLTGLSPRIPRIAV